MTPVIKRRILELNSINQRIGSDPQSFVDGEEQRYHDEVAALTDVLREDSGERRLVLLSGPSSSGKTTTARTIKRLLRDEGVDAHTVSMDDFYRGKNEAPVLADGSFDYETIDALRLDRLEQCMHSLLNKGNATLPRFDFTAGTPVEDAETLSVSKNAVVIFEGIHAINPVFEQHLSRESVYKVFVNTVTPVYDGSEKLLSRRDIRLSRRLLRDERFRSCPISETLDMWKQVMRGENEYMFPYVDTVDFLVDTTHGFEPCVFAPLLIPPLTALLDSGSAHAETLTRLINALSRFTTCPQQILHTDSMLREFVG